MGKYLIQDCLMNLSKPTLIPMIKETCSGDQQLDPEALQQKTEAELREQLREQICSAERAARLYARLSKYEREVLAYFLFQSGRQTLSFRQIEQGLNGIQPNLFRLGLVGLRRKGLVYSLRKQWGEVAYLFPEDVANVYYACWLEESGWSSVAMAQSEQALGVVSSSILPFYVDLFFLVDALRHEPGSQIKLTAKGMIPKRMMRSWEVRLMDRQAYLEHLELGQVGPSDYSKQLTILLHFLTEEKLLIWSKKSLSLDEQKCREWMSCSKQEMRRRFLQFWMSHYGASHSWLYAYQRDMLAAGQACWIDPLAFVERWEDQYTLPSIKEIKEQIKLHLLPLAGFGLISIRETELNDWVWTWPEERDEEEEAKLWLQAPKDLYADQTLPFKMIWMITEWFQLPKWESMLIFQLSKARVLSATERGISLEAWNKDFESWAQTPLPEWMLSEIKQWMAQHHQIKISSVTLLEIDDEHLLQAIRQFPELKQVAMHKISSRYMAVDVSMGDHVRAVLQKKGFFIQTEEKEHVQEPITPSFLPIEAKNHKGRIESSFPDLDEAIPAWNRYPDLWKKQLASYHEQTKREMVHQAVEQDLGLRVELHSGDRVEIWPSTCRVEQGKWVCYDQQKQKFGLDQLRKVQLIFPSLS